MKDVIGYFLWYTYPKPLYIPLEIWNNLTQKQMQTISKIFDGALEKARKC